MLISAFGSVSVVYVSRRVLPKGTIPQPKYTPFFSIFHIALCQAKAWFRTAMISWWRRCGFSPFPLFFRENTWKRGENSPRGPKIPQKRSKMCGKRFFWSACSTPERGFGVPQEVWTAGRSPERSPGVQEVIQIASHECHDHQPEIP